jgi:hypothetical protein
MISISLFVLLLATYGYSVPVEQRPGSPVRDLEFTTGTTIVDHEKINMHLISDEESTGVPNIHKQRSESIDDRDQFTTPESHDHFTRSVVLDDKDELTTPRPSEEHEHEHFTRSVMLDDKDEMTSTKPTEIHDPMTHSVDESKKPITDEDVHKSLDNFYMTTMETNTHFEDKAVKPIKQESEKTTDEKVSKRGYFENDVKILKEEPIRERIVELHRDNDYHRSSSDSFGKMTGFLLDERPKETFEIHSYERKPEFKRTEVLLPVKVIERKVFEDVQPLVETKHSHY